MEDIDSALVLREKLLSAGIDEIVTHGVEGFSLRRVAAACGASCAAPYKHFKNKDEFVKEIISYVEDKWDRLQFQICSAIDDPKDRISELAVANVKFKVANPLYGMGNSPFAPNISKEIKNFCTSKSYTDTEEIIFAISAIICGTAVLIQSNELENSEKTFFLLKRRIIKELK